MRQRKNRYRSTLECPGTFLGILVLGCAALSSASALDAPKSAPIKIAVFEFELDDLSPSAALLNKPTSAPATMDKATAMARQELTQSGRYTVIDASKVDTSFRSGRSLLDCDACEASSASSLGADQSMVGAVIRATETDYYVVIQIRDLRTGKILDRQEANFAGSEEGWPSGVRMLMKHQVLVTAEPTQSPR
jgi:curli biogenesis system outer membrane secretion channel CsgG